MDVLKQVNASEAIHHKVKSQVANTIRMAEYMVDISQNYQHFVNTVVFFRRKVDSLFKERTPHEALPQDGASPDNDNQIFFANGQLKIETNSLRWRTETLPQ